MSSGISRPQTYKAQACGPVLPLPLPSPIGMQTGRARNKTIVYLDVRMIPISRFRIWIRFRLKIGRMVSIMKNNYFEGFEISADYNYGFDS